METPTRLSCHNKFISAENITIFSVSSDDFLHAFSRSCRTTTAGVINRHIRSKCTKNICDSH